MVILDDSTVELDLRKIAQGDLIKLESVLESDIFEEVKFKTLRRSRTPRPIIAHETQYWALLDDGGLHQGCPMIRIQGTPVSLCTVHVLDRLGALQSFRLAVVGVRGRQAVWLQS